MTTTSLTDTLFFRGLSKPTDIAFFGSLVGYAVGRLGGNLWIGRTLDGGETWVQQVAPLQAGRLYKTELLSVNYAFAVGEGGVILRTTDGGGAPVSLSPRRHGAARARPAFKRPIGRVFDVLGRSVRNMMRPESTE